MRRSKTDGYSVIVFVPVRENQPHAAYRVGGGCDAKEAQQVADEIASEIRKHVGHDYIAARHVELEPQISDECEHCGYAWHGTAEDAAYNGGCCAADEDEYQARLAGSAA